MNAIGHRSTVGGLLGIHALTPLHAGAGSALGTVDLSVQRERQNGWPNIAGSALKGILRDAGREEQLSNNTTKDRNVADSHPMVLRLFGASKKHSEFENAGALSVTDARIIAFPIRSLKGGFAWVTCAAAIERLQRDLLLVGLKAPELALNPKPQEFQAVVAPQSPLVIGDGFLQLDDETFQVIDGDPTKIASWLAENLMPNSDEYQATKDRFCKTMVVVGDSDFTHIVKYATEISARIGLNYETKTVKDGALFYQEFVPTEALFYSVVLVNDSRAASDKTSASEMLQSLQDCISRTGVLQIGGDETTGKGFCSTRLWTLGS